MNYSRIKLQQLTSDRFKTLLWFQSFRATAACRHRGLMSEKKQRISSSSTQTWSGQQRAAEGRSSRRKLSKWHFDSFGKVSEQREISSADETQVMWAESKQQQSVCWWGAAAWYQHEMFPTQSAAVFSSNRPALTGMCCSLTLCSSLLSEHTHNKTLSPDMRSRLILDSDPVGLWSSTCFMEDQDSGVSGASGCDHVGSSVGE